MFTGNEGEKNSGFFTTGNNSLAYPDRTFAGKIRWQNKNQRAKGTLHMQMKATLPLHEQQRAGLCAQGCAMTNGRKWKPTVLQCLQKERDCSLQLACWCMHDNFTEYSKQTECLYQGKRKHYNHVEKSLCFHYSFKERSSTSHWTS